MNNTPRLLFAGLCRDVQKSGMEYTLEGFTHHLVTKSYPYPLDHGIVTCWELGDQPFTEHIELVVPIKSQGGQGAETLGGERQVRAKDPRLLLHTDVHFHAPQNIPLIFESDCQIAFRVKVNNDLYYECSLIVKRIT